MKKSLTLAMALALDVTASAYAANPFSDVPQGHWAYASVAQLAADGVVDGYVDGSFAGDKLLTRYEMAQIVAKAMANDANCDKLAAEFADELDTLGVRVAKLEKGADAVKITGEVRYHYAGYDGDISGHGNELRSRIWVKGQVNDDWSYTGMIQNTQDFTNDTGDEEIKFQRAYVEGKIGGVALTAGRWNQVIANGNLYDTRMDGIEASYGKDVKVTAFYGKPTDMDDRFVDFDDKLVGVALLDMKYEKTYGVKLEKGIGIVDTEIGYTVFKDGAYKLTDENGNVMNSVTIYGNTIDLKGVGKIEDNKVLHICAGLNIVEDLNLSATYLKSDFNSFTGPLGNKNKLDDEGYVVGLSYKGAKASIPGSYGVYANWYDQGKGTVMAHTMDGYYGTTGFKGWMLGANYTFAKNIVAKIEYYDLESKAVGRTNLGWPSKQDMETLWAQVVFTF